MLMLSVLLPNLFPSIVHAGLTDIKGRTPLEVAVEENETDTVEYLHSLPAPSTPLPGVYVCVKLHTLHVYYIIICTNSWHDCILYVVFYSVIWFLS